MARVPNFILSIFDKISRLVQAVFARLKCYVMGLYQFLLSSAHPLFMHIFYFISISTLGFIALKSINLKETQNMPRDLDLFFTSVSAATVSSMSTIEMEVLSNAQLFVLTILMLIGGEVLTSTIGLCFTTQRLKQRLVVQIEPTNSNPNEEAEVELSDLIHHLESGKVNPQHTHYSTSVSPGELKYNAARCLANFLIGYLLFIHLGGSISILLYMSLVSSAKDILHKKDIRVWTFSIFTTVSSFSNCGFIPTNENMLVFRKNSGLLLLIIPQVLVGNTMFPPVLRSCLWVFRKLTKRKEYDYLLKSSKSTGYYHLLPGLHSVLLASTVIGFILIQIIVICSMEWHSESETVFGGLNSYGKLVAALFLSVNSRHTGESVVNLSALSAAVLVLFVIMMYLPPHTTFIPTEDEKCSIVTEDKKTIGLVKRLVMSQLSYLAIFVILICIAERRKLAEDPLNFSVFNIVIEVISAYGNVGFSTGYSCELQLKPDGNCKDMWYGFVGKWSSQGKVLLIFVMFFGRLKKFNMHGGKAWKLG